MVQGKAVNTHAPKQTKWWVWGVVSVAAIDVIVALGYGLDWFGTGGVEKTAPAVAQTARATE